MKKTLVVLLALMMVFAFATTAMAADEQYVPYADIADQDVDIQTAIERLTILGALTGYDAEGTKYAPAQLITREEFATIGVRIAGLEDQVALYASMASAFKDVEEGRWSEGYINAANANGIMIGRGNGIFDPKANVTMQEVTTVLLRAVGYDDKLPGAWPSDYNTKAVAVGITEYVDYIGPKAATRGEVASLVNETLDLWTVQYVDNEVGQGIGIITGSVDKDGYAYVRDMTNEKGKYGVSLLNQTFDAYLYTGTFADTKDDDSSARFSEAMAWGFEDFADWELIAYANDEFTRETYDSKDPADTKSTLEFATLYGISKGQDVTDLGWQKANITVNDDNEIIYIDLTSDIVRTADVTTAQAKDIDKAGLKNGFSTTLTEGGYGEIWYDASGKVYAAKDFSKFEKEANGVNFGIVDDVDKYNVYFKDIDHAINSIKLTDKTDEAFYLAGEGFIDAADLEEGDVVYAAGKLASGSEYLYLAYRPQEGTRDDMSKNSVEIDDVEYGILTNSAYSYDGGTSFNIYNWPDVVDDYDWSDKLSFVPAYAFINLAYFSDEIQLTAEGILDSYEIRGTNNDTLAGSEDREITGINILFAGDKEPTLIPFAKKVTIDSGGATKDYPVEGSYVHIIKNSDGEFTAFANNNKIWKTDENVTELNAEWNDKGLAVVGKTDVDENYRFNENAVIFVLESDGNNYDRGSAQSYTVDDFKTEYSKAGFSAAGMTIVKSNDNKVSVLCVRDITGKGEKAYGFGLYKVGDTGTSSSSDSWYFKIDGEKVLVDAGAKVDVRNELANVNEAALIAYRTVGGKVMSDDDIFVIENCTAIDLATEFNTWADGNGFADNLGYELVCGTVESYDPKAANDNQLILEDPATMNTETQAQLTFYCNEFIRVYDFNLDADDRELVGGNADDLYDSLFVEDGNTGNHVLVVYDKYDSLLYAFVYAGAIAH